MIKYCEEKLNKVTIKEGDMGEFNSGQVNNSSNTKIQDEILELIEEIKEFEKKFEEYDIKKTDLKEIQIEAEPEILEEFQPIEEELVEVEPETLEEFNSIEDIEDIKKPIFKNKIKKEKIIKSIDPVTFRYRFNNEGKFENIDLNKRKLKTTSKKSFILKRIKIRKKEKTESTETEKKSIYSKFKTGLAKLKRVIPNRSIEGEEKQVIAKEE